VARRIGTFPIQVLSIEVGARRPLGVSSAGIAILAALPAHEARRIVANNQVRFTGYRTTAARALDQIAATRRRGYCLHQPGLIQGTKDFDDHQGARRPARRGDHHCCGAQPVGTAARRRNCRSPKARLDDHRGDVATTAIANLETMRPMTIERHCAEVCKS
jgi:Bacterial transcriptional regulator